jgi:HD-like signal output (HDOD) protein
LESFTASLLHDIGKLILLRHMTPEGFHVLERAQEEAGFSQREAEKAILGVDHAELGGLIARHWQLPETIVRGITYHHNPEEFERVDHDTICWVVHLADLAAESAGAGIGDIEVSRIEDHSAVLQRLGMTEDGFMQLCERVADSLEAVMQWYA